MSVSSELRILVSIPYMDRVTDALLQIAERHPHFELLLDSGAFTAWRAGTTVRLDDYCRSIEACRIKPWRYLTLDVIGDHHATLANYRELLRRGLTPVPVFTRGTDPAVLEEYYASSDMVAIGGLVGTPNNRAYVNGIMRHVAGRPVHLLGFTQRAWLKVYRPYSVDSTSWEAGGIYGAIPLYIGNGRMRTLSRQHVYGQPSTEIQSACQRLGIDWPQLRKPESWKGTWSVSRCAGARSWTALSIDVAKHLGTRLFLALTTAGAAQMVTEAFEALTDPNIKGLKT